MLGTQFISLGSEIIAGDEKIIRAVLCPTQGKAVSGKLLLFRGRFGPTAQSTMVILVPFESSALFL